MRTSTSARRLAAAAAVAAVATAVSAPVAYANDLTDISLSQSDPTPSATSTHTLTVSNQDTATTVRCVTVTYSVNADGSGGTPTGFSASSAAFGGTFLPSWAGWTAANSAGVAKVTSAGATPAVGTGRTITLAGLVNGSVAGTTYYANFNTYSDAGCTAAVDRATTALVWTGSTNVSVQVEPTLGFTVAGSNAGSCNGAPVTVTSSTGTSVPLGRVNVSTNAVGAQLLSVDNNSAGGYTIYARSTGTMGPIANWGGTNGTPTAWTGTGTAGFGYSTDHALSGGSPTRFQLDKWAGLTTSNDEVAYEAAGPVSSGTSAGRTKVCYKVGVDAMVAAGSYSTTVIYTAVPVY